MHRKLSKNPSCSSPFAFGAGKGKLLEAMQCGTPSITTGIGAESMQGYLPWNDLLQMIPMFSLRKLFNYIRINRVGFRRKKTVSLLSNNGI
jgi:hypothetical protein